MASFTAEATNIYSDSIHEKAIVACFPLCHDIAHFVVGSKNL
jgi:hypothetical protein